jgi:hypothetical protein
MAPVKWMKFTIHKPWSPPGRGRGGFLAGDLQTPLNFDFKDGRINFDLVIQASILNLLFINLAAL